MKIRRIILEGVNNFERFDYTFEYDWTDEVPDSLLLLGPNGSGKTTLLNVMAGLWELFKQWIEGSAERLDRRLQDWSSHLSLFTIASLEEWKLLAVEIIELAEEPLWVFHTSLDPADCDQLTWIVGRQETHRIGTVLNRAERSLLLLPKYYPPGHTSPLSAHDPSAMWNWADEWRRSLAENILGKRKDLPNIVFIESEDRKVPGIEEPFQVIREPQEFRWLARYESTERRKGSLENYLYNLSAVDKPTLDQILAKVNAFLIDKRIVGFDKRTSALMVEVNGGERHTIDLLSSGEKQVLMLITFITRWLRPGGIVLIDEPDLHLHISWINALVSLLRRMVAEQDGQLIIASHESSLWERFTQSHQVPLGIQTEIQR
jgi:ABC-type cobalamin/Fe3+-siderophores transport system ATPase subunit